MLPRLRQLVLAAPAVAPVAAALERDLALARPFHDAGVGHFGLENAVYAAGDTFVEVVAPIRADTAVGRFLDRGGPGGYMVMFEVPNADATRKRIADAGIRIVWEHTEADIVDLHLHPKDVGAAIVALDVADPVGSWRWGGPDWTAAVPPHAPGGLREITVAAEDPEEVCRRWRLVLGLPDEAATADGFALDAGAQRVRFVPSAGRQGVVSAVVARASSAAEHVAIAGVDVTVVPAEGE